MKTSPTEFKEKYIDSLIQLHWRQWSALGVASNVKPEENWVVDLEALIISTFVIGRHDKRLFAACLEWLTQNGGWINRSRLKKIAGLFTDAFIAPNERLISLNDFKQADNTLKKFGVKLFDWKAPSHDHEALLVSDSQDFYENFKPRGVVTKPEIKKPVLMQLKLRGILGRSARADVFLYLLHHEAGNSNSIAKELLYDQKNVYTILEKWTKAEIVIKISGDRSGNYSLRSKDQWLKLIDLKKQPKYLNWATTFLLLDKVAKMLSIPQFESNRYILSSFFRDNLNDAKKVAQVTETGIPEPGSYPGETYFEPFADSILETVQKL